MKRPRGGAGWWRLVLVIVVPVLISTAAAVMALFRVLAPGSAQERLDAVRTGLAVGAGIGAMITLALALRRQQATEHDATERRLTELYVKAVDQLGSDKAAVRHGGLYALERVAQDNPTHRQTIVDVICAYLRAPYTPPTDTPTRKLTGLRAPLRPAKARPRSPSGTPTDTPPTSTDQETRQELQVRLTAQRILRDHLQPRIPARTCLRWFPGPAHTFWPDIDLDLTGATLNDFDLIKATIRNARFDEAQFNGVAEFRDAQFNGYARFDDARFNADARFDDARFNADARFDDARFNADARFDDAEFNGRARFSEVKFSDGASFEAAKFNGDDAMFRDARFNGYALFDDAEFNGRTWFNEVKFSDGASFKAAKFTGARFDKAEFNSRARFDKAEFNSVAAFDEVRFNSISTFNEAKFSRTVPDEVIRHLQSN